LFFWFCGAKTKIKIKKIHHGRDIFFPSGKLLLQSQGYLMTFFTFFCCCCRGVLFFYLARMTPWQHFLVVCLLLFVLTVFFQFFFSGQFKNL
jgi:hypothetical protein